MGHLTQAQQLAAMFPSATPTTTDGGTAGQMGSMSATGTAGQSGSMSGAGATAGHLGSMFGPAGTKYRHRHHDRHRRDHRNEYGYSHCDGDRHGQHRVGRPRARHGATSTYP